MMVQPNSFGWNPETSPSNSFQRRKEDSGSALDEFHQTVKTLRDSSIDVLVASDSAVRALPDAVFPNNWISTHADGTVVLYPMLSALRRLERRQEIIDELGARFRIERVVDFTQAEKDGAYLEGTGSLVLDRVNKVAYVCQSSRSDLGLAQAWCDAMEYRLVAFSAQVEGKEVYHTNVLMSVGTRCAVVCLDWVHDDDRDQLVQSLTAHHHLVDLSPQEAMAFAGNVLEVGDVLAGSWDLAEEDDQRLREKLAPFYKRIIGPKLPTIWSQGGGGLRCMLCEIFLETR